MKLLLPLALIVPPLLAAPPAGATPHVPPSPPRQVRQSAAPVASPGFLNADGKATLVPNGSVLVVPAGSLGRMAFEAGAEMIPWADFLAANRSWLSTVEVTPEQAVGTAPLPEGFRTEIEERGTLVVATHRGRPIPFIAPLPPARTGRHAR